MTTTKGSAPEDSQGFIAIVDYGLGNLFSIKHACEHFGLVTQITNEPKLLQQASAVILPGVGAFADAMQALGERDLVVSLMDYAQSGRPLLGICLGMQLLLSESFEFGQHRGLGLIEGTVTRFPNAREGEHGRPFKVPQVGWNRIHSPPGAPSGVWDETLLSGQRDGAHMYFVHSYYTAPVDSSVVLSVTRYGPTEFCSTLRKGNIFGCQYHPERSGDGGLKIYEALRDRLRARGSGLWGSDVGA